MARISGVDLPRDKRVEIGLTYIYGIGLSTSKKILADSGVDPDTRVKDLTDDEVRKISDIIASAGNWLLSRHPSQKGTSCTWTEHKEQRTYT